MLKSEKQGLERKKREWDIAIRGFNQSLDTFKRKFRLEFKRMINFIMFYKPKDKLDKYWHIGEMLIIYGFLYCLVRG